MAYESLRERCRYLVLSSDQVTPVIRELWLQPLEHALDFVAGQYMLLCDRDERVPQRSYSVANAPRADGRVSMLVTLVQGGPTSSWAQRLDKGDEVLLEGPYGTFISGAADRSPLLLLGAGSGLAPVRALAEAELADDAPERVMTLFFSCRTRDDLIDVERMRQWQRDHAGFRYLHTLTREPGAECHERIPCLMHRVAQDLRGWQVFVAGPSGFVVDCARAARALGAAPTDIHTEEFFSDPQPWSS